MAGEIPGVEGIDDLVEIGRGGTATVYRGIQRSFGRTVAVKVLDLRLTNPSQRVRFERECMAIGALSNHPNIVTVHHAGVTANDQPYLVMEHLPMSLADRLADDGPMEWHDAVSIGLALAAGVEAAHEAGVLHRDIKPENVLLTPKGVPRLTDFGLARLSGSADSDTSTVRASLTHASPELIEGKAVTVSTDVYSLASTIHQLITATPPFLRPTDESMVAVIGRILRDPPPSLLPFGVPAAVEVVLVKAMSKRPADRHASIAAFADDLRSTSASVLGGTREMAVPAGIGSFRRRNRVLAALAIAGLLVAAGAGLVVASSDDDVRSGLASEFALTTTGIDAVPPQLTVEAGGTSTAVTNSTTSSVSTTSSTAAPVVDTTAGSPIGVPTSTASESVTSLIVPPVVPSPSAPATPSTRPSTTRSTTPTTPTTPVTATTPVTPATTAAPTTIPPVAVTDPPVDDRPTVPNVSTGLDQRAANQAVGGAGLTPREVLSDACDLGIYRSVGQSVAPGTRVDRGSVVTVTYACSPS